MTSTTALKSKVSFAHDGDYQSLDVDAVSYLNVTTEPTLVPTKKYIVNSETGEHLDIVGNKYKVTQHKDLDVLNGIAYNKSSNTLFVTGKLWDKLFEIKIFPKK